MPAAPGISPLPTDRLTRLRDIIAGLKEERDRLRTELAAAGGLIDPRLGRVAQLVTRWTNSAAELRAAADDPHCVRPVAVEFRSRAARIEKMVADLEAAIS